MEPNHREFFQCQRSVNLWEEMYKVMSHKMRNVCFTCVFLQCHVFVWAPWFSRMYPFQWRTHWVENPQNVQGPVQSLQNVTFCSPPLINQVSVKSPEALLTLPIHIGNVSLDKNLQPSNKAAPPSFAESGNTPASTSITNTTATPTLPERPAPKPAPRPAPRCRTSSHNSPSAPPAEYRQGAEGGTPNNNGYPNKRQSQLVSPNAFSYAPGLFFSGDQQHNGPGPAPSEQGFNGTTGTTAPYPAHRESSIQTQHILPPDYNATGYPQGQLAHVFFVLKDKYS